MSDIGGRAPVADEVASRPASSATVVIPMSTYMLPATEATERRCLSLIKVRRDVFHLLRSLANAAFTLTDDWPASCRVRLLACVVNPFTAGYK